MDNITIKDLWLIPFPGFYSTLFEPRYDHFELIDLLELTEEQSNDDEFMNKLDDSFDFKAYAHDVGEKCADTIEKELCSQLGIKVGELFSFSEPHIWSPREYNFSNDHLEVRFTSDKFGQFYKVLLDWCEAHKDYLMQCIKRDNSIRSGFVPFYSNKYDEWMREWQNFDYDSTAFAQLISYIVTYDIPEYEVDGWLYDWMTDICEADYYTIPEMAA